MQRTSYFIDHIEMIWSNSTQLNCTAQCTERCTRVQKHKHATTHVGALPPPLYMLMSFYVRISGEKFNQILTPWVGQIVRLSDFDVQVDHARIFWPLPAISAPFPLGPRTRL